MEAFNFGLASLLEQLEPDLNNFDQWDTMLRHYLEIDNLLDYIYEEVPPPNASTESWKYETWCRERALVMFILCSTLKHPDIRKRLREEEHWRFLDDQNPCELYDIIEHWAATQPAPGL